MQSIIELDLVGSTNEHAKGLAKNGYPAGTIVWAHEQTAGKGRHGNTWTSNRGNLFMSVILRPDLSVALVGQLSFLAAVALAECLDEILPRSAQLTLKWPNDVLLSSKKVAGILLESEIDGVRPVNWVVLGVGLNISSAPEEATQLSSFGIIPDLREMVEKIYLRVDALLDVLASQGFLPIQKAWMQRASGVGSNIKVRLTNETTEGKFLGIDTSGELMLELKDGSKRSITSGEVYL